MIHCRESDPQRGWSWSCFVWCLSDLPGRTSGTMTGVSYQIAHLLEKVFYLHQNFGFSSICQTRNSHAILRSNSGGHIDLICGSFVWVRSQPLPVQSLPMTTTTIWHPLPVTIITRWQPLPLTTITGHHYQVSFSKKTITSHHYHMTTTTIWRSLPHDNHYHMTTTTTLPKLPHFL